MVRNGDRFDRFESSFESSFDLFLTQLTRTVFLLGNPTLCEFAGGCPLASALPLDGVSAWGALTAGKGSHAESSVRQGARASLASKGARASLAAISC